MSSPPRNKIFRAEAIQYSLRQHERQNLARFMPFPMFICLWILIAVLLCTGYIAWNTQLPVYIAGNGIVVSQKVDSATTEQDNTAAAAVIFVPISEKMVLHTGEAIQITIDGEQSSLSSRIQKIESQTMSPQAISQRYGQGRTLVTQPSLVVSAPLPTLDPAIYEDSDISAQIEVGSQNILSMIIGG